MPFSDVNLEKLFIFNKFLSKKLPSINQPLPFIVREDVDMDSYKIVDKGEKQIIFRFGRRIKTTFKWSYRISRRRKSKTISDN